MTKHTVEAPDFATAWFELLLRLYHTGAHSAPRGFETNELLGVQVRVDDMTKNILVHPARNLSYRFMVAEWLWMSAGRNDVKGIAKYNKHIAQFSDDGKIFAGAYGPRIEPQMPWILEQLQKHDSRQAVVQIWSATPAPSKDVPCTLSWQLLARDGKLHAVVTMRSSDVWLGLPYDAFNFSMLTMGVAGELGLTPGTLVFNLGSSHLYERDCEKASTVLLQPGLLRCISSPLVSCRPPAEVLLDGIARVSNAPWSMYWDALRAATNADALEVLSAKA